MRSYLSFLVEFMMSPQQIPVGQSVSFQLSDYTYRYKDKLAKQTWTLKHYDVDKWDLYAKDVFLANIIFAGGQYVVRDINLLDKYMAGDLRGTKRPNIDDLIKLLAKAYVESWVQMTPLSQQAA